MSPTTSAASDGRRRLLASGIALSLFAGVSPAYRRRQPTRFPLFECGLAVQDGSGTATPVPPTARLRRFQPRTRVLVGDSSWAEARAAEADRSWLRAGTVPGPGRFRSLAEQALLDLRSLTAPNGAVVAGWDAAWHYVWPRDASFAIAAYAVTGHLDDAGRALSYLAAVAPHDGNWQARYLPDGSGDVPDNRGVQADGAGWVLWAASRYAARAGGRGRTLLRRHWPMLAHSADAIADSLGAGGHPNLPPPSADYWERPADELTLGVAAPCLAGLRAAVVLASDTGRAAEARRWRAAAGRLSAGIASTFARTGYHRTTTGDFDAAVTFAGPPYLPRSAVAERAVRRAYPRLRTRTGGIRPGAHWMTGPAEQVAWTPETAMFALSFATTGQRTRARAILSWLAAHTTSLGSLPENVSPAGQPASVTPLAWTDALVLLALGALGRAD